MAKSEKNNENEDPEWTFLKDLQPGSKKTNPQTAREFERLGPIHAIVGESFQNSLDAKDPEHDGPVVCEMGIWDGDLRVHKEKVSEYFGPELRRHISRVQDKHEISRHQRMKTFDEDMSFLTLEDFGTVGITGKVDQFGIPFADMPEWLKQELRSNRFLWFNRAQNATSDDQDRRGSWGEGKFTLEGASRLGAQISWSIRADDPPPRQVLMGQTTLRWHAIYKPPEYGDTDDDGTPIPATFGPYGFFSTSKLEDTGVDYAPLPVTDSGYISRFRETFNMFREDEPGLSILIPHPHEELLDPDSLARATIARWLLSIYYDEMVIRIRHNGELVHEISRENLRSVVQTLDWDVEMPWIGSKGERNPAWRSEDQWLGMIDLLDWAEAASEEGCFDTDPTGNTSSGPSWENPFGLQGEETMDRFRERFDSGEPIRITAHPMIAPYTGLIEGEFEIILRKAPSELSTQYFARERMGVPFIKEEDGVIAVVHCLDDHLGPVSLRHLLRDSEGPAHLSWTPNSSRVVRKARKWWLGGKGVRYVVDSVRSLVEHAKIPPEEEEHAVSLFSITIAGSDDTSSQTPPTGPSPIKIPVVKQPDICKIPSRGHGGGVRIHRNPEYPLAGKTIEVDLAYETARGNSWSKYKTPDFDEKDIHASAVGAELVMAAAKPTRSRGLVMTFVVNADDWRVDLSGFGGKRDVAVRVTEVE